MRRIGVEHRLPGSSPRMRGTCQRCSGFCAVRRFIPAHAGNMVDHRGNSPPLPVHPRACGEHAQHQYGLLRPVRFIPAHAGNIKSNNSSSRLMTVHPRACGEHNSSSTSSTVGRGSSPRMRGTWQALHTPSSSRRFIPAHAGNIQASCAVQGTITVHPRACGEHLTTVDISADTNGSSPRMRGTSPRINKPPKKHRFIPAHAGNIWKVRI